MLERLPKCRVVRGFFVNFFSLNSKIHLFLLSLISNSTVLKPMPCTSELHSICCFQDASTTAFEDELRQLMSKAQMPDFQATIGCVITALINRCKTNPKYYPRNFLLQIVQTRDLSYR